VVAMRRLITQVTIFAGTLVGLAKLQEAFHRDARIFGDLAGTRYDVPIQTLFDMAAKGPAGTGKYRQGSA